ncbi:hypothetical protein EON79_07195 [bacterium]|nr:MAG: hypothetical protein EON79_07195 [bacterium]
MQKVERVLRALPVYISETRLTRAIARLQSRLRHVVLFQDHPRECYAAFTDRAQISIGRGGAVMA